MPTDTRVQIRRNPYAGFEVWIWANGELTRRSFHNSHDLTTTLVGECVDKLAIEEACDQFERLEWGEDYPIFRETVDEDREQRRLIEIGALHTECGQLRVGIHAAKSETKCWQYACSCCLLVIAGLTYWLGVNWGGR